MKSIKFLSIALLFSILVLFSHCTDTKSDFVGRWEMKSSFVNGTSDSKGQTLIWTLFEDGEFLQFLDDNEGAEELKGNWRLNDDESALILHYQTTGQDVLWKIIEMDENAMNLEYTTKGFLVERRFVKTE